MGRKRKSTGWQLPILTSGLFRWHGISVIRLHLPAEWVFPAEMPSSRWMDANIHNLIHACGHCVGRIYYRQTVRKHCRKCRILSGLHRAPLCNSSPDISTTPVVPGGSDFRLMDRKAISVFRRFREHSRFIRGIVGGLGFRQTTLSFKAPARHAGTSKFSLRKMLHLAMDGIITNSTVPLRMTFYIGFLGAFAGLLYIIIISHYRHYRTGLQSQQR